MSAHSGFLYYYDRLGLDTGSYRVHYRFDNSGVLANDSPYYPQFSGSLYPTGTFFSQSGVGNFTGQYLNINNATGLASEFWTHILLFEKQNGKRGVLIDTLKSGEIFSGYLLGVNDNNKLYFQSYDQNGSFSRTSNLVLGKKNLAAVTKTNNLLSFYIADFANDTVLAENFTINGNYVLPSSKMVIGRASGNSSLTDSSPLSGFIDEYVYLTDALGSTTLQALFSGLCSSYQSVSGEVSGYYINEITGYATGITGVTGVTGYQNEITGSGIDPFSTGEYELLYGTVAKTGYLTSGQLITPLTGLVGHTITGDSSFILSFNSGLARSFYLDEISYIRQIDGNDISTVNINPFGSKINKIGGYDLVEGKFQLDAPYSENRVQLYINGVSQLYTGFSVTGNFYGSGIVLSGDYRLDGRLVDSTGFFTKDDTLIFDLVGGDKKKFDVYHPALNSTVSFNPSGDFVFFNGILLISGMDYDISSNLFRWKTDMFSTTSGALTVFNPLSGSVKSTGKLFNSFSGVYRNHSQVFLNGQRQLINTNFIENSSLDLVGQSGIFDSSLVSIYNNDTTFFE